MTARANQQQTNKTTATKRAAGTQGARDSKAKEGHRVAKSHPRRRFDDVPKADGGVAPKSKKTEKVLTIGDFVNGLLMQGKSTEEILKAVAKKFPDAHTSAASVAWYRSKLNRQGKH